MWFQKGNFYKKNTSFMRSNYIPKSVFLPIVNMMSYIGAGTCQIYVFLFSGDNQIESKE
jgi:hypothetical protein